MSTKHNRKHDDRSRSNYPQRPGIYSHGHMDEIDGSTGLRARQERRIRESCSLKHVHDTDHCNGNPFPRMGELASE